MSRLLACVFIPIIAIFLVGLLGVSIMSNYRDWDDLEEIKKFIEKDLNNRKK